MKSKYLEMLLNMTFNLYKLLKEDADYCRQWQALEVLKKECSNASNDNDRFKALFLMSGLSMEIKEKWKLAYPISPYLKLKKDDIHKTVRRGSSLAKFLYAFGLGGPELMETRKTVKNVSKDKSEMEKRNLKLLCSMLKHALRKSNAELGRLFKVDKKTIKNWLDEADDWPEGEKAAVFSEIITSRKFSDKDIYGDEKEGNYDPSRARPKGAIKTIRPKNLQPIEDVAHVLTSDGVIKTGRKLVPRSSD